MSIRNATEHLFHLIAGHSTWHLHTIDDKRIWRRWNDGQWHYREASEEDLIEDAWSQMR